MTARWTLSLAPALLELPAPALLELALKRSKSAMMSCVCCTVSSAGTRCAAEESADAGTGGRRAATEVTMF